MDKLQRATELGVYRPGWRYIDYALDCPPNYGWIDTIIWGEKGSGKSNLLLQHGYSVFHGFDEFKEIGRADDGTEIKRGLITDWNDEEAWNRVLDHVVFRPKDFAGLLNTVLKEKERLTWAAWDDVNVHFPKSMYSTNRRIWEKFSRNWEAMRANLSVFECSAPRKDRVVSFILGDMNWDVLVSARHKVESTRWFWEKGKYDPEQVLKFRLDIDDDPIKLENVPRPVWDRYWRKKTTLIDEGTDDFRKMLEDMDNPKTGPTPGGFPCPVCGKECANSYNLKVHMLKHQGEDPTVP